MRILLLFFIILCFPQCSETTKDNSTVTKASSWTEEQKRKHFAQYFAFRYGWGDGYFQNDTGETFLHFLNTQYPEVKSNRFHDAFLYALEEPYIDTARIDTAKHWLRLVITESFSNPYCLVLEKRNGKTYFTTKVTDGIGGQYTGNLRLAWTQTYPESIYDSVINHLNDYQFWQLPAEDTACHGGTDGSMWTVEGIDNGKYQYLHRWSPERCGDSLSRRLGETGKQLKQLSKLEGMVNASLAKENAN